MGPPTGRRCSCFGCAVALSWRKSLPGSPTSSCARFDVRVPVLGLASLARPAVVVRRPPMPVVGIPLLLVLLAGARLGLGTGPLIGLRLGVVVVDGTTAATHCFCVVYGKGVG